MPRWSDFEREAPELAAKVRERLDAHAHKTIATLRRDGSPRISGTESRIAGGDLLIGSMWGALKARDLQRDGRFALHSGSDEPSEWRGDAKVAGVAVEVTDPAVADADPPERAHTFRLDLHEASFVGLDDARDRIVIEVWRPGEPVRRIERE